MQTHQMEGLEEIEFTSSAGLASTLEILSSRH